MTVNSIRIFHAEPWCRALSCAFFATLLLVQSSAELIPSERLTDWTPGTRVGIPGGLDQYLPGGAQDRSSTLVDVTRSPYNADNTGATDAQPAIQAAYAASGGRIYLPPGTYRLGSPISVGYNHSHVTIRGAGPGRTILKPYGVNGIAFASVGFSGPSTVTGGLSKDSTKITVNDPGNFTVGQLILFAFEDQTNKTAIQAGAVPIVSVGGWNPVQPLRRQVSRVTGKSGNTITFSPGIYHAPGEGLGALVWGTFGAHMFCGIEDITIDMQNGGVFGVSMEGNYASWLHNVHIINLKNYGIYAYRSLQGEVRRCIIRDRSGAGTNGAGYLSESSSGWLVEDNNIRNVFPHLEINSSSGNVFAFNCFEQLWIEGVGIPFSIDTNHGPHGSHNLYEGNVAPNLIADGYFGGCSEDTVFRNWLHGTAPNSRETAEYVVSLKRFTRNYSLVGNVLGRTGAMEGIVLYGYPNIGQAYGKTGTAQPSVGAFWASWASPNGPGGWQEQDLDVKATTVERGNYFYGPKGAAGEMTSLSGNSLPNSLFRSSKPAFFGTLSWPPFDPAKPGDASYDSIPAGYRFTHNGENPPGVGPSVPSAPKGLRVLPPESQIK